MRSTPTVQDLRDDLSDLVDAARPKVEAAVQTVAERGGEVAGSLADRIPDDVVDRLPSTVADHLPSKRRGRRRGLLPWRRGAVRRRPGHPRLRPLRQRP